MYERFKFRDFIGRTFKLITILSQEVRSKKHNSIAHLVSVFPNLIQGDALINIDREWRQLRELNFTEAFVNLDVQDFWINCSKLSYNV